jgi:hypothetical protein
VGLIDENSGNTMDFSENEGVLFNVNVMNVFYVTLGFTLRRNIVNKVSSTRDRSLPRSTDTAKHPSYNHSRSWIIAMRFENLCHCLEKLGPVTYSEGCCYDSAFPAGKSYQHYILQYSHSHMQPAPSHWCDGQEPQQVLTGTTGIETAILMNVEGVIGKKFVF